MRLLFVIIGLSLIILGCRKKEYAPYIGTYDCTVEQHLDSTGYNFDTTYTATEKLFEVDNKNMQFLELKIPYKYITKEGFYEATHLVPGLVWGRQITMAGDSIVYYHHEATDDMFWYIRYTGTLVD